MRDRLSKERRSWNMSRIRGKDTTPEKVVRSLLHRMGYRFRLHGKKLPGRPDIVLPKYKTVVFIHGCFWHRHTIPYDRCIQWFRRCPYTQMTASRGRRVNPAETHSSCANQANWRQEGIAQEA